MQQKKFSISRQCNPSVRLQLLSVFLLCIFLWDGFRYKNEIPVALDLLSKPTEKKNNATTIILMTFMSLLLLTITITNCSVEEQCTAIYSFIIKYL
jgi:hypothetical protein